MKSELELLEEKVQRLKMMQARCNHTWNDSIYDPENKEITRVEIEKQGVHLWPIEVGTGCFEKVDRWSRTCSKCGKKEYTYEREDIVVKTIKKPKF